MWLRSPSPEATRAAARLLGEAIDAEGACIALRGPLGAGKTLFVKGLAEGLSVAPEQVSSPTFVIANTYTLDAHRAGAGGPRDPAHRLLVHVDLYRVASLAELEGIGFLDWLEPGNVVAVEWADRLPDALPRDRLVVELSPAPAPDAEADAGGSQRSLNAIASGPGAQTLLARWRSAIANAADSAARSLEIASG